jgi:hypothetical protein
MADSADSPTLSSQQAYQAAYRFLARHYQYERTGWLLRLLERITPGADHAATDEEGWTGWQAAVQETLDGAPLPDLPPPWDT